MTVSLQGSTPDMTDALFTLAERTGRMSPSVIREILKLTEQPGMISLAGGLPSTDAFPVEAVRAATHRVLRDAPHAALQYAASEGYLPLREWVARHLATQGVEASPGQILITSGSQQGLDLVGKVLIDRGSPVAVEAPTYLGALQAFTPYEPRFVELDGDDDGPLPAGLGVAAGARFAYLQPSFQNPTGRCMSARRRQELVEAAREARLPIVEDHPYGELWIDEPPPPPLARDGTQGVVLLGSFSKVLAPGLRLGWMTAPAGLMPKLLQAKQAADLHTPGFNQRIVHAVLTSCDGEPGGDFLSRHLPAVRERYRRQRDAMAAALQRHLPEGCCWSLPRGGMFFWVQAPPGIHATQLLPRAAALGVAYVPGDAFHVDTSDEGRRMAQARTLRLSFVTVPMRDIERGVALLGGLFSGVLTEAFRETTTRR
jgi:2-aminoadipate transaminase